MNVELIKDNDGKEIVNITLTEEERADLFHPVSDEFVKGGKYSWKLFKKRIKEFPFIKKQPRFKKYFYTQKRITLDGKEEKIKYETSYAIYREKKDSYMRDIFGDFTLKHGAKILGAYWTSPNYIYYPQNMQNRKEVEKNIYKVELFNDFSFMPLKIVPASLPEHSKKEVDICRTTGGNFLPSEFVTSLIDYCWGKTNEKPDLTGYIIRK